MKSKLLVGYNQSDSASSTSKLQFGGGETWIGDRSFPITLAFGYLLKIAPHISPYYTTKPLWDIRSQLTMPSQLPKYLSPYPHLRSSSVPSTVTDGAHCLVASTSSDESHPFGLVPAGHWVPDSGHHGRHDIDGCARSGNCLLRTRLSAQLRCEKRTWREWRRSPQCWVLTTAG